MTKVHFAALGALAFLAFVVWATAQPCGSALNISIGGVMKMAGC